MFFADDEESSVEGLITSEGLFDGAILVRSGEEFFIEPASRYFKKQHDFHSVMYKTSDVQFPENYTCFSHRPQCQRSDDGAEDNHGPSFARWTTPTGMTHGEVLRRRARNLKLGDEEPSFMWRDGDEVHYGQKDTHEHQQEQDSAAAALGIRSVQRTQWVAGEQLSKNVIIDPKKTTCMLYLQADHLFFQKMGSEEACIETMTRHVQKVNSIYRSTG